MGDRDGGSGWDILEMNLILKWTVSVVSVHLGMEIWHFGVLGDVVQRFIGMFWAIQGVHEVLQPLKRMTRVRSFGPLLCATSDCHHGMKYTSQLGSHLNSFAVSQKCFSDIPFVEVKGLLPHGGFPLLSRLGWPTFSFSRDGCPYNVAHHSCG